MGITSITSVSGLGELKGLGVLGDNYWGQTDKLTAGQWMSPSTWITSINGMFSFHFGGDGNLWVTDNVRNIVLHNFGIANRGAVRAVMQGDGNFVVYNASNGAIWNSGAKGAGAYIVIQPDGNLVIYLNGVAKWSLGTNQNPTLVATEELQKKVQSTKYPYYPDRIMPQQGLFVNWKPSITSPNGLFTYGIGSDGNTWVVDNIRHLVLKNFNTEGSTGTWMGVDGNYGAYGNNKTYFNTGTVNHPGAFLQLGNDGNLIIVDPNNNSVPWATGTNQSSAILQSDTNTIYSLLYQGKLGWTVYVPGTSIPVVQKSQLSATAKLLPSGGSVAAPPMNGTKMFYLIYQDASGNKQAIYVTSNEALAIISATVINPQKTQTQIVQSIDYNAKSISIGNVIQGLIDDQVIRGLEWDNFQGMFKALDYGFTTQSNFSDQNIGKQYGAGNDASVETVHQHTWQQTAAVYNILLDKYVASVKANPSAKSFTIQQKGNLLRPLLYCYSYFQTRAVNLSPFRNTGHSDRHNWNVYQTNWDRSMDTISRILDLSSYLGLSQMQSVFQTIQGWMGQSYGASATGGNYPTESGFRKLTDETYRSQSDAAAKNASVEYEVTNFLNTAGTEFWHGVVMPTIGFSLFFIMITGFQGLTLTADLFGFHLTQDVYNFIGGLSSGFPVLGKYLQMWIDKLGVALEKIPEAIRALGPKILSKSDMQDIEYSKISSLKDNELINFSKNGNMLGVINNDWNDDHGKILQQQLLKQINSRPDARGIWAHFNALDKLKLSGA